MQQHEAILPLQLKSLRLSSFNLYWQDSHETAVKNNWEYSQYLSNLCSLELQKREQNRLKRRIKESSLPSGKTFFNKFIKTLRKWKNEIANYFINRNTNAFVEGLNNKIKVLKRRCYGIFNLKHLFQRLHLDISGYRILLGNSAC